jgi:TPR repeat protein
VLLVLAAGLLSCAERHHPDAAQADHLCLADEIGELHLSTSIPQCNSEKIECETRCRLGEAAACLGIAYSAEGSSSADELRGLYRRACLRGAANACTNYAASIWTGETTDAQVACVRRTLEKACAVKEQFACGMVGRVMLESGGSPDYKAGRSYLQATCDRVGGFSCRVLAKHLESGNLGTYEPKVIPTLLKRACDGGDIDACGSHPTAAETFK